MGRYTCGRAPILMAGVLAGWFATAASSQDVIVWSLQPDLRIGSLDDPDYSFTSITDLEVGSDGQIFVAQPMERLIRVYDRRGRFLHTIGRDGSGPGEFRRVDSLTYTTEGLYALDKAQRRLTLFDLAGTYVDSWGVPAHRFDDGLVGTAPRILLHDASLVVIPTYRITRSGTQRRQLPVLQFDRSGQLQRVLGILSVGDQSRRAEAGDLVAVIPQPVNSQTLWVVPRDRTGIVFVHRTFGDADRPGAFHLVHVDAGGDTVWSRSYRLPARAVRREAIQDSLGAIVDRVTHEVPFPRQRVADLYEAGWQVPAYQAPVDRIVAGMDGTIWFRQGAFLDEEATWWVLNEHGDRVAGLRIPTRLNVLRASSDYVWGVETGEFDEAYVVRMKVTRP